MSFTSSCNIEFIEVDCGEFFLSSDFIVARDDSLVSVPGFILGIWIYSRLMFLLDTRGIGFSFRSVSLRAEFVLSLDPS